MTPKREFVESSRASATWEYEGPEPLGNRLGVALSGGGIRSAAFALGGLQSLQAAGVLRRVRYISAVSGGSYTASAYLSTLTESEPEAVATAPTEGEAANATPEQPTRAPWSPGSPEETYLTRNLGYLARGLRGRVWFLANLVYGVILNLLPLLCGSFIAGKGIGLLYLVIYPDLSEEHMGVEFSEGTLWVCAAIALAIIIGVVVRRTLDTHRRLQGPRVNRTHISIVYALACALLLTLCLGVLLPAASVGLNHLLRTSRLLGDDREGPRWIAERAAAGLFLITISLTLGLLSWVLLRTARARWLAFLGSFLSGTLLILTPCLLAIESTVLRGWNVARDLREIAAAVAVLLIFGFAIHNRFYSMHNFYRERLCEAFFLRRRVCTYGDRRTVRTDMAEYSNGIYLSHQSTGLDAAGNPIPELLIGAAVNAADKTVGFGSGAAPFVFSPTWCGSPEIGWTKTSQLERHRSQGGSDLTLPSMVAISGAALSPVMGRLTLSSYRFLLAMLNVRLGVWVPRPERDPASDEDSSDTEGRARGRISRALAWQYRRLKQGWLEPGPLYVLREGLGRTSLNSRFIYVTDGGHWENLGLYELVRRRCTHVVAFDASDNAKSALADLGRCCQLLFNRLGVVIRFEPDAWNSIEDNGNLSDAPIAIGDIIYPDAPPGVLIYCKNTLWRDSPPELKLYAKLDGRFPRDSTSNQFLTSEQFDAYRRLGWEIGQLATESLNDALTGPAHDESRVPEAEQETAPRFVIVR